MTTEATICCCRCSSEQREPARPAQRRRERNTTATSRRIRQQLSNASCEVRDTSKRLPPDPGYRASDLQDAPAAPTSTPTRTRPQALLRRLQPGTTGWLRFPYSPALNGGSVIRNHIGTTHACTRRSRRFSPGGSID